MNDEQKKAKLLRKNLTELRKIDIAAHKILDKMPFAAIYRIDPIKREWQRTNCEGTLFIYQRASRPYFSFLVVNRSGPSHFIEPLTMNYLLRLDGNFIYFQKESSPVQALWFDQTNDSLRIFTLLQKLVGKLKASTTEQAYAAETTPSVIELTD